MGCSIAGNPDGLGDPRALRFTATATASYFSATESGYQPAKKGQLFSGAILHPGPNGKEEAQGCGGGRGVSAPVSAQAM